MIGVMFSMTSTMLSWRSYISVQDRSKTMLPKPFPPDLRAPAYKMQKYFGLGIAFWGKV